ncbi:MAG: hypothetical protein ABEI57_04660 [Halapricum sp.]
MSIDRSAAITLSLLVVGLALIALPILYPPAVPDDRVEYYVEGNWTDYPDQTNLVYANLTAAERGVFDAARRASPDTLNRSVSAAPDSLTPRPEGISIYNVRVDGEYSLLQVKHLTYEADPVTQQLPRLGVMGLGSTLLGLAGYWRFARS